MSVKKKTRGNEWNRLKTWLEKNTQENRTNGGEKERKACNPWGGQRSVRTPKEELKGYVQRREQNEGMAKIRGACNFPKKRKMGLGSEREER